MTTRRMNVLVYAGNGCTVEAVKHAVYSLRRLLSNNYAVISIDGNAIINEPWTPSCALLVFPGGADKGYCETLNGKGNRRIRQYVERGGSYLGFCAGAYYGSQRCEFEKGKKPLEVVGDRELAFYPGICRGLAYPGFVYGSEAGARAVDLEVQKESLTKRPTPNSLRSYYNGGGVFVDAPKFKDRGVEILSNYTQTTDVDSGEGSAAVVYCKVGQGAAILSCPHLEFASVNLDHNSKISGYQDIIKALEEDNKKRIDFLMAGLEKLGMDVNTGDVEVPSISQLHLSALIPFDIVGFMEHLREVIYIEDDEEYLKDENDTFRFERSFSWAFGPLLDALSSVEGDESIETQSEFFRPFDPEKKLLRVIVHDEKHPEKRQTPYFDHEAYYASLEAYSVKMKFDVLPFGHYIMYGDVVTSTNTILEKNQQLLHRLPMGFTATANTQVAGRGRGGNVWVSPPGSLMFSTVVRHPQHRIDHAPIVFVQYITALAIVEGIKTYDKGFECVDVKIKWPNDILHEDAVDPETKTLEKIGGILVNSHYTSDEFMSVVGVGLNTTNKAPTTSLNALNPPYPFTVEKLLARILTTFARIYNRFLRFGFDKAFEDMYYEHWLHSDQIVTLESEGGVKAIIRGISTEWGFLMAEELGFADVPSGNVFLLQSDSNSFDFFKGLVKRKIN